MQYRRVRKILKPSECYPAQTLEKAALKQKKERTEFDKEYIRSNYKQGKIKSPRTFYG